jgi:hypothetical protein
LTILSLLDFITGIVLYLTRAQAACQPGSCLAGQPGPEATRILQQLGLSGGVYVALSIVLVSLAGLAYCAVAAVIIWRRPNDWMALLVSSMLITQGLFESNYLPTPFSIPSSPWYVAGLWLSYISPVQVLFFCALFPNGRLVPRWIGWVLLGICLIDLPANIYPTMPQAGLIEAVFVFCGFPLVAGTVVYRYRRVSTPIERQQTKWVVFGGMLTIVGFMLWFTPQIVLYSSLSQPGSPYDILGHPLLLLSSIVLPVCIGIAVLRYRLWDIDLIINRALVYGSLTAILAAVYVACVIAAQAITTALTGQRSLPPPAIVASTLLIAALFQPFRALLQRVIDRRFYRRRYDASKTLATFGQTLRGEVDLDLSRLNEHLLSTVQETMQPAHVSLWLREPPSPNQR